MSQRNYKKKGKHCKSSSSSPSSSSDCRNYPKKVRTPPPPIQECQEVPNYCDDLYYQVEVETQDKSTTPLSSCWPSNTNIRCPEDSGAPYPPTFYCGGTCVGTPAYPRHPPKSPCRRRIPLGPSFGTTNAVPKGAGEPCRRCGRPVFLAELQLGYYGAYHKECFTCCACGKSLDSTTVSEHQGELFCKGCYRRNFGTVGVGFGLGAGTLQTP